MLTVREVALTYDDISLAPRYSELEHRSDVNLGTEWLDIPVISSPMDTVTGRFMAGAMAESGGLAYLHRYNSIQDQALLYQYSPSQTGCAIGTSKDYKERLTALLDAGCTDFCVDVANTDVRKVLIAIEYIRKEVGDCWLTAGNICTGEAFYRLSEAGVDAVRVGIGGGSACTTRVKCGVGVPNVTALLDVASIRHNHNSTFGVKIIADGGIRSSGDAVKALACGADAVMLGGYLAGSSATPGVVIHKDTGDYKAYRGMASSAALTSRGGVGGSVEGESMLVPYNGRTCELLRGFTAGIRAGMAYLGCGSIKELHQAEISAVRVTSSGMIAATAHRKTS